MDMWVRVNDNLINLDAVNAVTFEVFETEEGEVDQDYAFVNFYLASGQVVKMFMGREDVEKLKDLLRSYYTPAPVMEEIP